MCGIVGYLGPRDAAPILLEGLARLEYRGYDSAGIALVTDTGELFVEKRAGKLANLRDALAGSTPAAVVGIGHTRWATHGRPDDRNAHPHVDCTRQVTVIHNGIIENFSDLRDELTASGVQLASETDTEVVAHLLAEAFPAADGDLAEAMRRWQGFRREHGLSAQALAALAEPGAEFTLRGEGPEARVHPVAATTARLRDGGAEIALANPYEAQAPFLRVEALHGCAPWDDPGGLTLIDPADMGALTAAAANLGISVLDDGSFAYTNGLTIDDFKTYRVNGSLELMPDEEVL